MLVALHRIVLRLGWCRPMAAVLIAAGLAGIAVSLFAAGGRYGHLLEPMLVLTLWGMMLFATLQLFRQIPPPVLPHDDFMTKLGTRILLALYSLLALLVVLISIILVWMSFRLITLD